MRKFVRDELILKPAKPSLSMHGFKKKNYQKKKNKTKKQLQQQTNKAKRNKPSFVSLVWLTNHIILQSMITYQIERLPVKRGLSGLSGLFRLQDIICSDCDNQCERRARGFGDGEYPPFSNHVRLIFATPLPSESLEQGKFTTTDRCNQTSIPELDFTRIPNGQSNQTLQELNTKVKKGF